MNQDQQRITHLTIVLEGARKYVAKMDADGVETVLSPKAMLRRIDEALLGYDEIEQQPIAKRIKSLRTERGWSQYQLAVKINATAYYVHELEAGEKSPTVQMLERLAKAFEVDVRVELG